MRRTYSVHLGDRPPQLVEVTGKRTNMFLGEMIAAGDAGITSIAYPGVRLADAIFKLRGKGFQIETLYEPHEGPFKGIHGRYTLKSRVSSASESSSDFASPLGRQSEGSSEAASASNLAPQSSCSSAPREHEHLNKGAAAVAAVPPTDRTLVPGEFPQDRQHVGCPGSVPESGIGTARGGP